MKRLIPCLLILALLLALLGGCGGVTSQDVLDLAEGVISEVLVQSAEPEAPVLETAEPTASPAPTIRPTVKPTAEPTPEPTSEPTPEPTPAIAEDGSYTSKEDVALYIHTYGHLPDNFITKKEARSLGWEGGSLEPYAPGKCIGGDRFGNYEGLLPEKEGRTFTECDIDTLGKKSRGAKRIIFTNDGFVYYTEDHYESFELLYGEE